MKSASKSNFKRNYQNHLKHLKRKAQNASVQAKAIAWRAQKRLCGRYRTLTLAGKNTKLVCVAIARELVGFIWDIVRHEMPRLSIPAIG